MSSGGFGVLSQPGIFNAFSVKFILLFLFLRSLCSTQLEVHFLFLTALPLPVSQHSLLQGGLSLCWRPLV